MENNDLWRMAAMLISKHGADAQVYARLRADEASDLGNNRACETWKSVAVAVNEMEQRASSRQGLH
jgi:hypothetical protein